MHCVVHRGSLTQYALLLLIYIVVRILTRKLNIKPLDYPSIYMVF